MKRNSEFLILSPSRRYFLKNLMLGAFSTFASFEETLLKVEKEENRLKKGQMFYRRLGRTGLFISEISLGGSPLPDWDLFLRIIERGVNYIDTSSSYNNGNSERQIGRLFKEVGRDKVYVGTKFHLSGRWTGESIIKSVEGSLERLKTDYIDVLLIHGAENEEDLTDERVLKAFERLKKEGKYRFRGLSCHSNHHRVLRRAVDCGYYDMIQLGYNVFDMEEGKRGVEVYEDYLEESGIKGLLNFSRAKDVGIIAMKTLKIGGKRQNLEKYKTGSISLFQAMLKWVLENRNITSVVTEMLTYEQMAEDLAASGTSLTNEERRNLFRHVAENSSDYCHLCGLCQRICPSQVKTTAILRSLAYHENYGKIHLAKETYSQLKPEETASFCQRCGKCERACPYGVSVQKKIREAQRILIG